MLVKCKVDESNWMRSHESSLLTITSPTGNVAHIYKAGLHPVAWALVGKIYSESINGVIYLTIEEMTLLKNHSKFITCLK